MFQSGLMHCRVVAVSSLVFCIVVAKRNLPLQIVSCKSLVSWAGSIPAPCILGWVHPRPLYPGLTSMLHFKPSGKHGSTRIPLSDPKAACCCREMGPTGCVQATREPTERNYMHFIPSKLSGIFRERPCPAQC